MDLSVGIALAVMLVGLVVMLAQKRFAEIAYVMFAMGLLATLLRFAGEATLRIH